MSQNQEAVKLTITPDQAIDTLAQIAATVQADLKTHMYIQECLNILRSELEASRINIASLSADRAQLQEKLIELETKSNADALESPESKQGSNESSAGAIS